MEATKLDIIALNAHSRKESIEGVYAEAFRKAALADYDLTRIPGINKIRDAALDVLNKEGGLRDQLTALETELGDHSKHQGDEGYKPKADVREEIKALEANIRKHEEFCLQCEENIVNINKGAQQSKQVAANLLDRCNFFDTYVFDLAALPSPIAAEEVQPLEKIHDPKTADQPTNPEAAREVAQATANFDAEKVEAGAAPEVEPTPAE